MGSSSAPPHPPRASWQCPTRALPPHSCVRGVARHCPSALSMRPRDGWGTPRVLDRARRVAWSSAVAYALGPLVLGSSAGHAGVRLQQ
eukprot:6807683-Alexandrium_andersonii.AAC.1